MSAIRDKERVFDASIRKKNIHLFGSSKQEVIPTTGKKEDFNAHK